MVLQNAELMEIKGGAIKLSAALISAGLASFKGIYSLGVSLGSALRRFITKSYC